MLTFIITTLLYIKIFFYKELLQWERTDRKSALTEKCAVIIEFYETLKYYRKLLKDERHFIYFFT